MYIHMTYTYKCIIAYLHACNMYRYIQIYNYRHVHFFEQIEQLLFFLVFLCTRAHTGVHTHKFVIVCGFVAVLFYYENIVYRVLG